MEKLSHILQKLMFGKEPQKIGLSQIKANTNELNKNEVSIKNKEVKLSDLMRRVS